MSESVQVMAERLGIRLVPKVRRLQVVRAPDAGPCSAGCGREHRPHLATCGDPACVRLAKTGRPAKATCVNGHDLAVHRRYVKGKPKDCRACHDLRVEARRRRQREIGAA